MIRALIFDCFGVLYRDNAALLYDLVPVDKQQELQDIIHACDHGIIFRSEYFNSIAQISGKTSDDIRAIDSKQHSRNEALIEHVRALRSQYKIGMLSNIGDETMDRLFPEPERSQLFDAFVLSSQVGLTKPAPELFAMTAAKLGALPEECVMIDDLPANIEGAQLTGMQGIVYSNNRELHAQLQALTEETSA